ncbi:MAG TPA: HAD family phosphatase [Verrucomicrobiae bacterium]|nr:HAD family phosphatase [Verrucomicrobiae bacterium]
MKGILFDMDGVLIDAMPFHAEAFQTAFKETVDKDIDKKEIFLLEGMPGHQLVKEIFKRNNDDRYINDENIINTICKRKEQIFKEIQKAKAFEGVKELIDSLNCNNCLKAVVSGASKQEVESLLNANSLNNFNLIFSGEGLKDGKPHPEPFQAALDKLNLKPTEAVIVENAPLGVESAIRAGVRYIITLNNTPLELSDFKPLLPKNKNEIDKIVFKDTKSASKYLNDWCCK